MQLHQHLDEIHAMGAELYAIGNGAPSFIEGFRESTGYTGAVYTDPSLAVYRAAELRRGVGSMLSVAAAVRTVGAMRRGFGLQRTQGDTLQQGGVLVIAPDGRVRYRHVSSSPGDNAPAGEILRALRA